MSDFKYPADLIEPLKKCWHITPIPGYKADLPEDTILYQLLDVAYQASLITDESRSTKFRIIYGDHDKLNQYLKEHCNLKRFKEYVETVSFLPLPYNEKQIAKLTPAADYTRVMICVNNDSHDNLLKIWGLLNVGSSWYDYIQGNASDRSMHKRYRPPNCLAISSTHPGAITISQRGYPVLFLRDGKIYDRIIFPMEKDEIQNYFGPTFNELWGKIKDNIESNMFFSEEMVREETNILKFKFMQSIERITYRIHSNKHGGTLIFVPHNYTESLIEQMQIKYRIDYSKVKDILLDYLESKMRYTTKVNNFKRENITYDEFKEFTASFNINENYEQFLSDFLQLISSLANVDGAVVISTDMKVIGFGAEITNHLASHIPPIKNAITGETIDPESYGTRHRSAFRLCSTSDKYLIFVFSQDGGQKIIKKVGDEIHVWPTINHEILGL